jgi:hypothetical protein
MQLSAANLLLAAQQAAAKQAPAQPKSPAFAAALAAEAKEALFAPLDFKQTAPAPASPQPQGPAARIGSSLDIRV